MTEAQKLLNALCDKIATDILTVYGPEKTVICTRAQLILKETPNGPETNMGGRNKASISEVIRQRLEGIFNVLEGK